MVSATNRLAKVALKSRQKDWLRDEVKVLVTGRLLKSTLSPTTSLKLACGLGIARAYSTARLKTAIEEEDRLIFIVCCFFILLKNRLLCVTCEKKMISGLTSKRYSS